VKVVEADAIVSLRAGEAEGFAATTGGTTAGAGETSGDGFGDPAGARDESNQFTKPDAVEGAFSRFALGFPKVWS